MGCIIEFVELTLGIIQVLLGFILILFIPGYALILIFYPRNDEISFLKRITLSIIFSMITVMMLVLFIDEVLAINTTPINIAGAILIFSLISVGIWKAECILGEKVPEFLGEKNPGQNFIPALKIRSNSGNTGSAEKEPEKEEKK